MTLGVFAWALPQPAEDLYDFSRLDAIVERATAEGRSICLATAERRACRRGSRRRTPR